MAKLGTSLLIRSIRDQGPCSFHLPYSGELVRELDLVRLAIGQAAPYIRAREPRSSVQKYLAEFPESERKRVRPLGHDSGDLRRDGGASNSILITWQISFDYVRSKSSPAADLLL